MGEGERRTPAAPLPPRSPRAGSVLSASHCTWPPSAGWYRNPVKRFRRSARAWLRMDGLSTAGIVTGIGGQQDGSYLAELLLEHDYEVFGVVRRGGLEELGEPRLGDQIR